MSLKRARDFNIPYPFAKYQRVLPASFTVAKPRARSSRTYNVSTSRYRKRSAPYRALTNGDSHTNPVYPRPEVKVFDVNAAGTIFNATNVAQPLDDDGIIICLNQIEQGSNFNQRIGASVAIRNVAYRFELDLGTTPVPTSGRVILVWDKQPNNTLTTYGAIFGYNSYLSFMYAPNTQRFVVLRNQQFSLSPNGDQSLFFEGFCKINMKSTYGSSGAQVPNTGALLLVYISDQDTAANQPLIQGCWRIRYLDS